MKKKLIRFSLFIFILLLAVVPNIKAQAANYTYQHAYLYYSTLKSDGVLQDTSGFTSGFYIANKWHDGSTRFFAHFALMNSKWYIAYCKDMGKFANEYLDGKELVGNSNNGSISSSTGISETKRKLLEDLLSNGYQFSATDTEKAISTKQQKLSVISMQLLVWEIMEGARTSFDVYIARRDKTANSYDYLIAKNGCPDANKAAVSGTLCDTYRKIIDNVKKATTATEAPAFEKTYNMKWNSSKQLYYQEVTGIGNFKTCTANNPKVTVTVSGSKAIVSSAKTLPTGATVTCTYTTGAGSSGTTKPFVVFEFLNDHSICSSYGGCQGFIYGGGSKTFSKSFKVFTEKGDIKVVKVDQNGKSVSGAVFKIIMQNDSSGYNFNLNGNGDSHSITASGTYKVTETTVPSGYSKVSDFMISLDLVNKKITSCTNQGTKNGKITCLNGQVTVTYENDLITLSVINTAKNFKVSKIDSSGSAIKGATFQIKNSSGTAMKFKKSGSVFTYDTSGSENLVDSGNSIYSVSLLPNGEYTLVETAVPAPYVLASKESERTTKIKVTDGNLSVYDESQKKYVLASNAIVAIKNYTTQVNVLKIGKGNPLEGVVFSLLKEDKETYVNASETSSGVYSYSGTTGDASAKTSYVTNNKGYITINGLPEGKYYFKEEQTIEPYQVPTGDAAYTEVTIEITKSGVKVNNKLNNNKIVISNSANSFNFYKVDEDGNYLTSGKFKLQRWDDDKNRFVDMKVKSVQNDGTYNPNADIFEPDDNGKVKFGLTNGIATFINMPSGAKYRIVETDAPDGYVLDKESNVEVTIDKYGNASGLLILTNQKVSKEEGDAQAELIVNISTGVDRIPYEYIIPGVLILIGGLIFLVIRINKKGQKK